MAIRDVLWACPSCGRHGAIRSAGKGEACAFCGAVYARAEGARIRQVLSGTAITRSVPEWETLLPPPDTLPANGRLGPQDARVRRALPPRSVRAGSKLIGWAERFGPDRPATVSLQPDLFLVQEETGEQLAWPLEQITAVQPSSSTLQISGAGHPLVSLRFLDDSVRRWEAVLQRQIRDRCRTLGRGEITEFHPRIRFA
jgi:hypothetical protein